MADEIYRKVARVLDTLPNGFPATQSGVEIKLLKKVFTPNRQSFIAICGSPSRRSNRSPPAPAGPWKV